MPEAFWQSLNEPAPFDVRVNPLLTTREAVLHEFYKDGIEAIPTPWSPWGVRLQGRRPMANHPLFASGAIEVQDEGSQLLGLLCHAQPGEQVLDYCAGAGGKSLVLAATMVNKGQLILSDTVEHRLRRARERLKRAHIHNYTVRMVTDPWFKRQEGRFDCVLVDAPCSGTGTWRRNPDLKNRFTETDLAEVTTKQQEILSKAAAYVKPGGRLIYATCSLLPAENDAQITTFLQRHPHFSQQPMKTMWERLLPIPYPNANPLTLNLYPHIHYTDGFFVSMMTRQK
jgi:16S rRNA (cytosine967-C5)-methyltransferase